MRVRRGQQAPPRPPGPARPLAALAATLLALTLAACDALPGTAEDSPAAEAAPSAQPMDPAEVAAAQSTAVDPTWLCRPGEGDSPLPQSTDGARMTPQAVHAEGHEITVSGPFQLGPEHSYDGFRPEGVLLPVHPDNRGLPAPEHEGALGEEDSPIPPMVVRERVEVPANTGAPAPAAVSAHLTVGTCDDAPLPEGQFVLQLSGALAGGDDSGWAASEDVMVDVVDGRLRAVPGVVSAPGGEAPADLSPLACHAVLEPVGDSAGYRMSVEDPSTEVSRAPREDGSPASVTASLTVTSPDHGTHSLFQTVVVVDPETGRIVAGARNASEIPLHWMDEEGVTQQERASVTGSLCGARALSLGTYRAHGVAVTLDEDGRTELLVSDPWDVEIHDEAPPR